MTSSSLEATSGMQLHERPRNMLQRGARSSCASLCRALCTARLLPRGLEQLGHRAASSSGYSLGKDPLAWPRTLLRSEASPSPQLPVEVLLGKSRVVLQVSLRCLLANLTHGVACFAAVVPTGRPFAGTTWGRGPRTNYILAKVTEEILSGTSLEPQRSSRMIAYQSFQAAGTVGV